MYEEDEDNEGFADPWDDDNNEGYDDDDPDND